LSADKLIPIGLLFVCGLLLWVAGRRVMRTGFAAAGFLVGGLVGWSVGEGADLGVAPWIAGASGAVIVACIATLAFRLAVAAAVGLLLAVLAPMAVWTADERQLVAFGGEAEVAQPPLATPGPEGEGLGPAGEETPALPAGVQPSDFGSEELEGWLEGIFGAGDEPATGEPDEVATDDDEEGVGDVLRRPIEVIAERFREVWDTSPAALRGSFLAAAAFGAMLGFVIGALAPSLSATLVSSMGGSFLLLTTGLVLAGRVGFGAEAEFLGSVTVWTIAWLVLAVIGLGIQSIFRPKKKGAEEA
jgi:hypothetical protein